MKGDHVVLVLVSCTLCISVPTSAAPPHKKTINTAIEIQQGNETLSENTEKQKSKLDRVLIQDKNDEPVRRLKDDKLKLDDNPDHEQPQQFRTDSKLDNPGQDEKQPGADPNIDGNTGQDEKQPGTDPKVDGNPGQDEMPEADPKVNGNPGQDEKQSEADPKVDDNPGQDELQPGADTKGADKPGQDEIQPRVDQKLGDTSDQAAQSRHDQKLHNSAGHNHEIAIANSNYKKDSDSGIISAGNDQENKKSEAKSQDFENLITEDAADNTEDTQDPGDSEVKEDPDTSNTALASVKEDGKSNTSRDSSVQNSDVKDGVRPGDVQRKEPDNRESHPIIFSESSNPSVAPLPTQGIQDPNKSTPGSEKVSSSMKTTTTTTTTTVSSLSIVPEIAKPENYLTVEDKMGKASDSQSENDLPYDDNYNINDPHEEEEFEVKPAGNEEPSSQVNNGGKFRDDEDSHFFAYFLTIMVTAIIFYLVFHNKQRIIALIIEGRAPRSGRTRRSSSRAKYHKLDNNLEEAITATKGSKYDRMY